MKSTKLILLISLTLSTFAGARGILWDRDLPKYATKSGLLNAILAKEICSCHWIAGLAVDDCLKRGNLPSGSERMVVLEPNESQHVMTVRTSRLGRLLYGRGPDAWAMYNAYHPEKGCRMVHGPLEASGH